MGLPPSFSSAALTYLKSHATIQGPLKLEALVFSCIHRGFLPEEELRAWMKEMIKSSLVVKQVHMVDSI